MVLNPTYQEWYVTHQQVLAYLLLSLSREIMGQVAICTTAASVWSIIGGMYTSGTRARSVNTHIALTTMKKGNDSIAEYVNKARTLADEMVLAGKKIDDEELISYILTGLDFKYNSVVSALVARPDAIMFGEVYSQLMSYEQHIERQQQAKNYQAYVNAASHGRVDAWIHVEVTVPVGEEGDNRGALHHMLATPTAEATPARLQIQDQNVKCASKEGTSSVSAAIDLMTRMFLMRGMLGQLFLHILLIQVGI
jgi:hypothetical protein